MSNSSPLGAIKRRWWIVLLFAVVGAGLGALPEPEKVEELERTFRATHTLLLNDTSDQQGTTVISPSQVTLFVTTGEVPARAAETLDFSGNAASLAGQVTPEFDFTTGALTISASGTDRDRVELVADTFADELTLYLAERQDIIHEQRLAASLDRLSALEVELQEVTQELAADPENPVLIAQQNAISRRYSVAFEQSEELDANPPLLGFTTLQRAQAVETTDRGLGAPRSRESRALLGGVVGAALGLGVAVFLGMLDRRIRTQEQAEEAFGMRARVLVPKVRDRDRDQLVVRGGRHDPLSDAYRTVRNVVAFVQDPTEARSRATVTLVVSAGAGDGKTSLAVNLAAATAEAGQRTVLVNADFRRPRLSEVFAPDAPPAQFLYEDIEMLQARTLVSPTGIERLRIFDLSQVNGSAGELARQTVDKLPELAELADAIVIDTSPVGATAEVLDLVPYADTIVVVSRVGHTSSSQAKRAIGILRDLTTAPMLLVLGGLKRERNQYYEYHDRERGPRADGRRRRTLRGRKKLEAADPEPSPEPELEAVD